MELKCDLPYPSPKEIEEDYRSLRVVSPAYAGGRGELTAVLQYVYQSIVLEQNGYDFSKTLLGIAVNEMRHFELLGSAICRLGAPPVFTACPPYPVGYYSASCVNYAKSPREMICADILAERAAISDYKKMLSVLCNQPLIALIGRIIQDEELHLKTFEKIAAAL